MAQKPKVSAITLPECHCLAVRRAARQVTRLYDRVLEPSGLRTTQFSILASLHRSGPMTINNLAEALVLDRTTLGRNVLPLLREGLVAANRRSEDRRSKSVQVTRTGGARLKMTLRLWTEAQTRLEAAFGPHACRPCELYCTNSPLRTFTVKRAWCRLPIANAGAGVGKPPVNKRGRR
jgi:DNA-binding MarR family transcriptional regulator